MTTDMFRNGILSFIAGVLISLGSPLRDAAEALQVIAKGPGLAPAMIQPASASNLTHRCIVDGVEYPVGASGYCFFDAAGKLLP